MFVIIENIFNQKHLTTLAKPWKEVERGFLGRKEVFSGRKRFSPTERGFLRWSKKKRKRIRKRIRNVQFEKQKELKELTASIGTKNYPNSYKGKLHTASQSLQELSKLFKFSISVGLRYHDTSLKKNPKFYLRVKSYDNNFKNIYVGRPNDIKKSLFKIRNFSFENYNNDDLKLEIRLLYTVYIRNFVWGKNWKTFFNQKHQLKDVEQWCLSMSNEFLRW